MRRFEMKLLTFECVNIEILYNFMKLKFTNLYYFFSYYHKTSYLKKKIQHANYGGSNESKSEE